MLYDVIKELLVVAITSIVTSALAQLWHIVQTSNASQPACSARHLMRQFYASALSFPVLLVAAFLLPVASVFLYIKALCGIFAFLAFVFLIGAFDAAIAFHPDKKTGAVPADDHSGQQGQKKR